MAAFGHLLASYRGAVGSARNPFQMGLLEPRTTPIRVIDPRRTDDGSDLLRGAVIQPCGKYIVKSDKHLLILTRNYAPEPTGIAPVVHRLAAWFAQNGYFPTVATSRPSYPENVVTPGYELGQCDEVQEDGVEVRRWATFPVRNGGFMARIVPETRFLCQLIGARVSGRLKPANALISVCPSTLVVLVAPLFKRRNGRHIAFIYDIQSGLGSAFGSRGVRVLMRILRIFERVSFNRVDEIIVLSEAMARSVRELGVRKPITVLPPQVDCDEIKPLPRPDGAPLTLLYSGVLGRKQGLGQILDLAAHLRKRAPDVQIIIRGQGPMKSYLDERIADEQLVNVVIEPLVPQDQVCKSLAQGDVHLVPQLAEGGDFAVPSKAFSIMAAGRPFIATASPDSSMALLAKQSGAFLCVSPGDIPDFANKIMLLLNDSTVRSDMGFAGRSFVEMTASTAIVLRRVERLLYRTETPAAITGPKIKSLPGMTMTNGGDTERRSMGTRKTSDDMTPIRDHR